MSTPSDLTTAAPSGRSNFKFPHPPLYEGARDGFKCENWLTSVTRFFVGAQVPLEQRTLHAVIFLSGNAATWWEGNHLSDDAPWSDFVTAFRQEFRPAGFYDHVRALLFSISMTSTVPDYISRTRRYLSILCLPGMSPDAREVLESAAKSCFLAGTPVGLRQMLQGLDIGRGSNMTIHELCSAAEQFDSVYNISPSAPVPPQQTFAASSLSAQANPMAMEIDNLRVELNALRRQLGSNGSGGFNNNNNGGFNNNNNRRLQRLTPEDRAKLMASNSCFRCRKQGHIARDCGRSLNNLSASESFPPDSGKAPSDQV